MPRTAAPRRTYTYGQLAAEVARVRGGAARAGRRPAATGWPPSCPTVPEALIGLLAAASVGAVWSCCPPDYATQSVIDRFRQIEPSVLIVVDGYRYGGREVPRAAEAAPEIAGGPAVGVAPR